MTVGRVHRRCKLLDLRILSDLAAADAFGNPAAVQLQLQCKEMCTKRTAEMPIFMAVSCLSPVIIHTRIPASISVLMASGTPSCTMSADAHLAYTAGCHNAFSTLQGVSLQTTCACPINKRWDKCV